MKRLCEVIGMPIDSLIVEAKAEIATQEKERLEEAKEKKSAKKGK